MIRKLLCFLGFHKFQYAIASKGGRVIDGNMIHIISKPVKVIVCRYCGKVKYDERLENEREIKI